MTSDIGHNKNDFNEFAIIELIIKRVLLLMHVR